MLEHGQIEKERSQWAISLLRVIPGGMVAGLRVANRLHLAASSLGLRVAYGAFARLCVPLSVHFEVLQTLRQLQLSLYGHAEKLIERVFLFFSDTQTLFLAFQLNAYVRDYNWASAYLLLQLFAASCEHRSMGGEGRCVLLELLELLSQRLQGFVLEFLLGLVFAS